MISRTLILLSVSFPYLLQKVYCEDEPADAPDDEMEMDMMTLEQAEQVHAGMDDNKNGLVSIAEVLNYAANARKRMAQRDVKAIAEDMDGDGDGKLSLQEALKDINQMLDDTEGDKSVVEHQRALEIEKFQTADVNGDNLLDLKEMPAMFYPETNDAILLIMARAAIAEKDRNGDGELTPVEFWKDAADDANDELSEEEERDFKLLDKDGSGKINLEEFKKWESGFFHTEGAINKLFELADKNSDMHVDLEELNNARGQIVSSDAWYHFMDWIVHAADSDGIGNEL